MGNSEVMNSFDWGGRGLSSRDQVLPATCLISKAAFTLMPLPLVIEYRVKA